MRLRCGVYGEGILFSIEIERNAEMEALQKAIFDNQRYHERFSFPPGALKLYLAGRKEEKETKWLKQDCHVEDFLRSGISTGYEKMLPFYSLDEDYKDYFGESFHPGRKDIHVLVELPSVEPMMRAIELGYYDPGNVPSEKKVQAFWYTNDALQIHVLFKKEVHALYFQSRLITESITSCVSQAPCPTYPQRIFGRDYDAQESESPQGPMSSTPTEFSVIDQDTPAFKYQRIETDSRVREYAQYDRDDNNRLALSLEMHGAYDGLGFDFPVVNMEVVDVSDRPVLDNRYKVDLLVSVYSEDYAFLLDRLKAESTETSNPLVKRTFVHVEDPATFCECMAWKHKNVEHLREDYFSMDSAVM